MERLAPRSPEDVVFMTEKAPLPRRPLSAGHEIDAWCTRCRMDLGHRIVAMVGRLPKRVVCMTCHSEHNYRPPKSEVEAKAAKVTKTKAAPAKKAAAGGPRKTSGRAGGRAEWETRIRSGAPFRSYRITETFESGELISHTKFGEGFVSVVTPSKVTVVFSDGEKTLIHGAK